ncbi:MAG: AMP-binding protein, partial [Acidobacteria bacterium]|nr:AMP-binding protein [Acidobacteriota bacterium]
MLHADVLGERARLTPDKTALVWVPTGERFSYRELDDRATRMATAWIGACGFAAGDRVGLLAHNRVEFIDAFFAAAKSGVILVPFGTRLTPHEIDYIARDAGLRGFIYDGAFADTVRPLQETQSSVTWIALDTPAAENHIRLADLLKDVAQGFSAASAAGEPVPGTPRWT